MNDNMSLPGRSSSSGAQAAAFEMRGISKAFGPTQALDGVEFSAHIGEVHALLGENGAGKSSLMNVLTGLYRADAGEVRVSGQEVQMGSPRDSLAHGIGMVHQHFELVEALTAFENIVLGVTKGWSLDRAKHERAIHEIADRYGFELHLDRQVADLDIGDKQKVEIVRVLYAGARVLLLDEPTTHLVPDEVDRLFTGVRRFVEDGGTAVLIAHKLSEVLSVADRITVLRKGRNAGALVASGVSESEVVRLMMGGAELPAAQARPEKLHVNSAPVLNVRGVSTAKDRFSVPLVDVALQVPRGGILGIAGVAGNGQQELVEVVCGLRSTAEGGIELDGQPIEKLSVAKRIRRGLALIPGDRMNEGVLRTSPLYESFALGQQGIWKERWSSGMLRRRARDMIDELAVSTPSERAPSANLSGGNIQKICIGRALNVVGVNDGGCIVAVNPSNGLDVSATAFVRSRLVDVADAGKGVLLLSEDLDELLELCDRIAVISGGRIVRQFDRPEFNRQEIGSHMVHREEAAHGG